LRDTDIESRNIGTLNVERELCRPEGAPWLLKHIQPGNAEEDMFNPGHNQKNSIPKHRKTVKYGDSVGVIGPGMYIEKHQGRFGCAQRIA